MRTYLRSTCALCYVGRALSTKHLLRETERIMPWGKLYDDLHDHKKVRRARKGSERPRDAAPMGLWVLAMSWCLDNYRTDGWVPEDELDRWDSNSDELAQRLVDAGLWERTEHEGEPGFQFHEWTGHQESADRIDAKRDAANERMRARRGKGSKGVRANSSSTSREVQRSDTDTDTDKDTPREARVAAPAGAVAESFERFWQQYPRKVGRGAAAKSYAKALQLPDVDEATILQGLANARQVWDATSTEDKYKPHPSTWLNQQRWADEVPLPDMPSSAQQGPRRPSFTVALCADADSCPGPKHEWSDARGRNRFVCPGH